jgi:RNA-directed DNA polymerase
MTKLERLKAANNLEDVAHILNFKPSALSFILYKKGMSANYTTFDIKKRNGGMRSISAPTPDLKLLQRRLAKLLQDSTAEIRIVKKFSDNVSHGFRRGRSIITNAKAHRRHRFVFNVDLTDFFGTINFGRVRGYFIKDQHFSLNPKVATVLAQIACFNNKLPQGSPCSPIISNLIGNLLDIHLVKLALRGGCTYTRYADDLTFSTNKKIFPPAIAQLIVDNRWGAGPGLLNLVAKSVFHLNPTKTRMQYCDSRQEVTGLVINRKINVRREYRHLARALAHTLLTTGAFEFRTKTVDPQGNVVINTSPGTIPQLRGMLEFIDGLDFYNEVQNPSKLKLGGQAKLSSRESLYQRFLLYSEFFAASMPMIICEGKTDNVYLRHAIRSLAKSFPALAAVDPSGKIKLRFRLFKYTNSDTGRILGIQGGSPNLAAFVSRYYSEASKFKSVAKPYPVIVLIDNDSGAGPVHSAVKNITKQPVTRKEPFIHVFANLYLVATPLGPNGVETKIEDCFDASVTSTILGGKVFNPEKNMNTATEYSKAAFAREVVQSKAASINFKGFVPLLTNVVGAINDWASK